MIIQRGEVWLVELDPTVGAELRKIRPAVVVNRDSTAKLPLRIIVPLTSWNDRYAVSNWLVRIDPDSLNGLSKTSAADTYQVRSISVERFKRRIGQVPPEIMLKLENGLRHSLRL